MLLRKSKSILIVVAVLATLFPHAGFSQETDGKRLLSNQETTDNTLSRASADIESDSIESKLESSINPQMSRATPELDNNIIALAPFTELAPGTCSVITNMLIEFCQNYPGDSSCNIQ